MVGMSSVPLSWSGGPVSPPARVQTGGTGGKAIRDKLTFLGFSLFIISLTVAFSAFERFRLNLGTLYVHMYLMVMLPFCLFMVCTRLREFPGLPLASLFVFCTMYSLSTLSAGAPSYNDIAKIGGSAATLVTTALMVRSQTDFRAGVLGLCIAVGSLAFFGMHTAENLGSNSTTDMGNKNTYSLYALPAILLSGYLLVKKKNSASILTTLALIAFTFGPIVLIFMGGNRSGWAGCALIALMLLGMRGVSIRSILIIGILAYGSYFAITRFGSTETFAYRVKETLQGNHSDLVRQQLFMASMQIGLDNPILGVSPQQLPYELGRRLETDLSASHNVIAHIVGGSGFLCFISMMMAGVFLWRIKPLNTAVPISPEFREARKMLRMMLFLWFFRGQFTAEVLFSPGFNLGLGLLVGLCMVIARRDLAQALQRPIRPQVSLPGLPRLPSVAR